MIETNLMSALGSGPQLRRFTLTHADLTAAAATELETLCTLPKGSVSRPRRGFAASSFWANPLPRVIRRRPLAAPASFRSCCGSGTPGLDSRS